MLSRTAQLRQNCLKQSKHRDMTIQELIQAVKNCSDKFENHESFQLILTTLFMNNFRGLCFSPSMVSAISEYIAFNNKFWDE